MGLTTGEGEEGEIATFNAPQPPATPADCTLVHARIDARIGEIAREFGRDWEEIKQDNAARIDFVRLSHAQHLMSLLGCLF